MQRTGTSLAVFAALAAMPSWSFAQSTAATEDAPVHMSFIEALRRGAADPPSVRASLARANAATAQVALAEAGYLPTFSVSGTTAINYRASYSSTTGIAIQGRSGALVQENASGGFSAGASADGRIPIYDFGRTANNVTAAERGASAARSDTYAARVQAMGAVASAYLTVLNDHEAIGAAQATITQRDAQLRISDGLVTIGTRPPIDRTTAEVNLDVARLALTSAEASEALDRASLSAALGIDPVRGLDLEPFDEAILRADDDIRRAADAAVASRPELAAARTRLLQAESQASATRAGRNPVLAGSATAQVNYNTLVGGGSGQSGNSELVQGGLSLTWPLFDPSVRANIHIAEANVIVARENLAQQSLQVRAAAVQAAISLRAARLTLEQSERLAVNSAAALDLATGRYQSGAAPLLEVINAQATDASARITVVRSRLSWQLARVNVMVATGEIANLAR